MNKTKKSIFLTGATGVMGKAGLEELCRRLDRFNITLLVRPSKTNKRKMMPYAQKEGIHIVWGDLMNYDDVLRCVKGTDIVLHVGGMVSPQCDPYPKTTRKVNLTSAQHIVNAIKAQPNADDIALVYIGSIAQTGHRNVPYHWGRTGDPINPAVYDHYAISKCEAERIIVESGVKKWVCLRQSGILYPDLILNGLNPIIFHIPLHAVVEWATVEDSGRLLAKICEDTVPEEFWNRFYNISSGPSYRLTFYDFVSKLLKMMYCPPPEKIFNLHWFALRNFHCYWFTDADILENYLHFRGNVPSDMYFKQLRKQIPRYFTLVKIIPAFLIKAVMFVLVNDKKNGTMSWIKQRNQARISAYFGSYEKWKQIPTWKTYQPVKAENKPIILNHGYDENKATAELDMDDMKQAALFRGGRCLSENMIKGDMATPLEWECQFGHRFTASPALVLLGGHWCPDCFPTPYNFDAIAKGNPFFAQAWYASHDKDEHNVYDESIFDGWEK
ncbi:MAG: NAD(P)-dependent oxidoreductase [Bacteroidales bacterium]|jgi:nucleoside-diphosphate-sugar epimerase|nr:NAD(P)-dependent oxidoreductase [Bacteroidales bacterium]NLO41756.1 NAD(P)-dependent oxidoreductase [Bacteroidales bacterium]